VEGYKYKVLEVDLAVAVDVASLPYAILICPCVGEHIIKEMPKMRRDRLCNNGAPKTAKVTFLLQNFEKYGKIGLFRPLRLFLGLLCASVF